MSERNINTEICQHEVCDEKFLSISKMMKIMISVFVVALTFMVNASMSASDVKSKLALIQADYEARFKLAESKYSSELTRLNNEIASTKEANNRDLVTAIERVGLQQQNSSLAISNQIKSNTEKIGELSRKIDLLQGK